FRFRVRSFVLMRIALNLAILVLELSDLYNCEVRSNLYAIQSKHAVWHLS
ncbi:hypothetical protein M2273_003801, partial [Mucilaginibacter lappiensis]